MEYGYIRVSTTSQNIDRQLAEIAEFGIEEKNIYIDRQSGKDFNRGAYLKLRKRLRSGDLLVIKSIDRLGRNYQMIIEEWSYITKTIKANIVVLDMPLLDTRQRDGQLIGMFISDIVLQILSFVAQNEREAIRQRQREGIRQAQLRGVRFGRPRIEPGEAAKELIGKYQNGEIRLDEVLKKMRISKATFFRIRRRLNIDSA